MRDWRTIGWSTLVAGTLDLAAAILQSAVEGGSPGDVLRSVAAGPLGDEAFSGGVTAAIAGLVIHFALMAAIAAVFVLAAAQLPILLRRPWLSGPIYGLLVWAVMYLVVLPLRWPDAFPLTDPVQIGIAILFHTALVGLPIALIAARRA